MKEDTPEESHDRSDDEYIEITFSPREVVSGLFHGALKILEFKTKKLEHEAEQAEARKKKNDAFRDDLEAASDTFRNVSQDVHDGIEPWMDE